jgi:hypothetical protein
MLHDIQSNGGFSKRDQKKAEDAVPVFLHNKGTAIEIDLTIVKWRRDACLLYLIDAFSIRILLFT